MQHNPYATPVSELSERKVEAPTFFVVSCGKLIIINMATFGFYGFYCFYQSWKNYKRTSGADIYPLVRVFFAMIYNFSLFSLIHKKLQGRGEKSLCPPYLLALLMIVLAFSEPILAWVFNIEFSQGVQYGVMGAQSGLLIFVQRMINRAEGDPAGTSNSRLTALNYLWICTGLALWGLMIYATTLLLPDGEMPFGIRL